VVCGFACSRYFDFKQWVNYFVHSGHLDIEGRKMSKSLKNFITIREALEEYSARQIRVFYLTHRYNARMDYSKKSMNNAADLDQQFAEFFLNMKALVRAACCVLVQHLCQCQGLCLGATAHPSSLAHGLIQPQTASVHAIGHPTEVGSEGEGPGRGCCTGQG